MTAVTIGSSMPQYPREMTKGTSRPSVVRHEPMGSGLPAASLPWLVLASMHRRPLQVLILILAPRLFRSAMLASSSAFSDRNVSIVAWLGSVKRPMA